MSIKRYGWLLATLVLGLLLAACGGAEIDEVSITDGPDCPTYEWPLAEPDYTSKATRDFSAFEEALEGFSAERAAELDPVLLAVDIPQIQTLLDAGELTSAELVTYYVDRIRRYDVDKLNSVLTLNPQALEIAAALDAERADSGARGPMHGIPVLLKDNIATADMTTTAGAYALRDWQPDRDAFLTQQLREAGAIILGKANLSEFANYTDPCTPNGFSALGGQTENPHGPFDPLGSSSGSAVAAAANLATVTVGTETQGSLIMPASVNGVVGLKTSRGLVSRDYVVPLLEAQDSPGPMGRSVTDVAILLTALTGTDANDPATAGAAELAGVDFLPFASQEAAAGVRVGVATYLPESIETQAAVYESLGVEFTEELREQTLASYPTLNAEQSDPIVELLEAAGLEVVRVDALAVDSIPLTDVGALLPYGFRDGFDSFMNTLGDNAPIGSLVDVAALNAEDPDNRVPYGQRFVTGAAETEMTAEEFEAAVTENRATTQAAIRGILEANAIDALFLPRGQQYAPAGFPALTVPVGLDSDGHPVSLIFIGDYLSEPQLLAVGYALEQEIGRAPGPDLEKFMELLSE